MFREGLLALTLVFASPGAWAQSRISATCGGCAKLRVAAPPGHTGLIGLSARPFVRGLRGPLQANPYLSTWPYYYDYPDYTDLYGPSTPPSAAVPPAPAPQLRQESAPAAELLELQGNQWVRVSNFTTTASEIAQPSKAAQVKPMAPAVLIFRDGRREEITSYSIIGPVIYTKGDYWATGSWTRSIQVSDLDLPATFKENQERGVGFNLPSGPDEIVIRP